MSGIFKKYIKIIVTGFLFVTFGLICLFGNLFFYPVLIFNLERFRFIRMICRTLVRYSWGMFLFCCNILGYCSSNSFVLKSLDKDGEIIICNHPSLLDIVFFLANIKDANCIVKDDLRKNIFLYPAIKACGYILNSQNEEFVDSASNALKNGQSLIIFPEGSRTKGDEIIFHKAAAYIAVKGAKTLTCVYLKMNPKSLKKGQKWYQTPDICIKFSFSILKNIDIADFFPTKSRPMRARMLHQELKEIYLKEVENG